ncbi:MAG TPA: LssY C-terminal domain-containing protein [Bryobacteraceae bacterium]|nr:LssY C-terminal domain-containing protein [Bryobacteraceae bacterium]
MRVCLLLLPVLAMAQEIPAGTEISIRLITPVSTRTAKVADPVNAVIIAPVMANGRAAIAAGSVVHGKVEKVAPPSPPDTRAALRLTFYEIVIGGRPLAVNALVSAVDNAREKVDEQGQINGIVGSQTISGELDSGLDKLSSQYSGFASILSAAKNAILDEASADIAYPAGVEMTLRLTTPFAAPPARIPGPPSWPATDRALLSQLLPREPFQTTAQNPPKPSDLTNLLLVATPDDLRRDFAEAGWSAATSLNPFSKFETLRALAEDRGYDEAPVSILLVDGKPPDMVFEKTTDTFARRHHLRVWRRPFTIEGLPVWAVAATHDTGIDFSEEQRTFIHRIDSHIDRERDKVVYDLLYTGRVKACQFFNRPQVPREATNATGDRIETDARISVLWLN